MFAVFKSGGKQYRVEAGNTVKVERIDGKVGSTIKFDDVLSAGGAIEGLNKAVVEAEIIDQARDKKVIIFKKKRRQNYRRKKGHRQYFTLLRVVSITGPDGKTVKAEAKKAEAKKPAAKSAEAKADKPATKKAPAKKAEAKKTEAKKPAAKKPAAKKEEK